MVKIQFLFRIFRRFFILLWLMMFLFVSCTKSIKSENKFQEVLLCDTLFSKVETCETEVPIERDVRVRVYKTISSSKVEIPLKEFSNKDSVIQCEEIKFKIIYDISSIEFSDTIIFDRNELMDMIKIKWDISFEHYDELLKYAIIFPEVKVLIVESEIKLFFDYGIPSSSYIYPMLYLIYSDGYYSMVY